MGRSWPSFIHEECSPNEFAQDENGTLYVATEGFTLSNSNFTNEEGIKNHLEAVKSTVESCWTCETCDFMLEAGQDDGNVTSFHFLEFSGTRQLAEDSKQRY